MPQPLIRVLLTAGSVSDWIGAAYLLPTLSPVPAVLADRDHDVVWIRTALRNQESTPSVFLFVTDQEDRNITTENSIGSVTGERICLHG